MTSTYEAYAGRISKFVRGSGGEGGVEVSQGRGSLVFPIKNHESVTKSPMFIKGLAYQQIC